MPKSFLNGFMALPFGLYELAVYLGSKIFRWRPSYPAVREVWLDRSPIEILLYGLGQILFLSWPVILLSCCGGPTRLLRLLACWLAFAFAVFTALTLFTPVGTRARYGWLLTTRETGYERLFLGQMPPSMLFSARGRGATACLLEALMSVIVIGLVAAGAQFAIWSDLRESAFSAPKGASVSLWDFIYWTTVTMSTTGYGDIFPLFWQPQLVAMAAILLAWMYLAALLPTLINLGAPRSEGWQVRGIRYRRGPEGVVRTAIDLGVAGLYLRQEAWGGWRGHLSDDCVASACAYLLLSAHADRSNRLLIDRLRDWLIEKADADQDPVGWIAAKVALSDGKISLSEFKGWVEGASRDSRAEDNLPVLLGLMGGLSGKISTSDALAHLPDIEEWKQAYGSHWATYALLVQFMKAIAEEDPRTVDQCSSKIVQSRTARGSWNGDVILTSLAALALGRSNHGYNAVREAVPWLLGILRERNGGMPLVGGLEVWDTAWVVSALLSVGEDEGPSAGSEWLARASRRPVPGKAAWSWSEEGGLICMDSTSLACQVLRQAKLRDVRAEVALRNCVSFISNLPADCHRWPTFVEGDVAIVPCPVVSSRCVGLASLPGPTRRIAAETIMREVANGWRSEWFSDSRITDGLVLFYLAPFCAAENQAAKEIGGRIAASAHSADLTVEVAASGLLGLAEAGLHLDLTSHWGRDARLLARYLLSSLGLLRDGCTRSAALKFGVFGQILACQGPAGAVRFAATPLTGQDLAKGSWVFRAAGRLGVPD